MLCFICLYLRLLFVWMPMKLYHTVFEKFFSASSKPVLMVSWYSENRNTNVYQQYRAPTCVCFIISLKCYFVKLLYQMISYITSYKMISWVSLNIPVSEMLLYQNLFEEGTYSSRNMSTHNFMTCVSLINQKP